MQLLNHFSFGFCFVFFIFLISDHLPWSLRREFLFKPVYYHEIGLCQSVINPGQVSPSNDVKNQYGGIPSKVHGGNQQTRLIPMAYYHCLHISFPSMHPKRFGSGVGKGL